MKASTESRVRVEVSVPLALVLCHPADPDTAALQVVDRPHGIEISAADAVDGREDKDIAVAQLLVQRVALIRGTDAICTADSDVGEDVPGIDAGVEGLLGLGFQVAADVSGFLGLAGPDVSVDSQAVAILCPCPACAEATN